MKCKLIRLLALLLTLVSLITLLGGCGAPKVSTPQRTNYMVTAAPVSSAGEENKLTEIARSDRLMLYANLSNGQVEVFDKKTGVTWSSTPEAWREDSLASGFHKVALQSVITVTYLTDTNVTMSCGSSLACVSRDALSYSLEGDGSIVFFFYFPKENFYIPVRYAITDTAFEASILTPYILENIDPNGAKNTIQSIELLPFFGAGSSQDDGYMLVPDGSGALIYYNNNRLTAETYSKAIFGFDNGTSDKLMGGAAAAGFFTVSENQYMPVFGVSRNRDGFLAVIASGAPRGTIKANVSGRYTGYNTIWSAYSYRTTGSVRQPQKDGSDLSVSIAEKNLENWCDYTVSYNFLETGKNTYADMAAFYRDYLTQTQGLAPRVTERENIPFYLDLYGYIEKTKSFLGIPVETKISMTTLEDANRILDNLNAGGIGNVVLKYNYWSHNSYFDKIPTTARVDGKVGSAKEMQALQQRLESAGGALYLGADLLNIYKTGNGISQYDQVLQSVANTAQRMYAFRLDSAMTDSRYNAWYLLRPTALLAFTGKYAENLTDKGYHNLALDNLGTMLYSELSTTGIGRNHSQKLWQQTAWTVANGRGLMLQGANDFVASAATHLLETSHRSSGYDLEDVSVPFYQMVFHGYISYTLSPTNLSSDLAQHTLYCLEFGANPLYSLVGENVDELIDSRLDRLYSTDADKWMAYIQTQYTQLNEALRGVQTSTMVGHSIQGDARAVTYSNGTVIYVNYGTREATMGGQTLAPKGYAVVDAGGNVICSGTAATLQ